ncbi:MAG: pyridoxine 5'-phosphate synthase [Planctomycetota bacterium]
MNTTFPLLGVNIDHVATIRQARRTYEPDPLAAATMAELGGADAITFHLREDRRHIQDHDVQRLIQSVSLKTNFELAAADEVVSIAIDAQPDWALLVPESRQEVTTEGGLNVSGDNGRIADAIKRLQDAGILVSLFVDPDVDQIRASAALGVDAVELHTGPYALANAKTFDQELTRLKEAGKVAVDSGLGLHAGHGLNYVNVRPVAQIDGMAELNIGHSIVSRAVFVGMQNAVAEMRRLIDTAVLQKSVR